MNRQLGISLILLLAWSGQDAAAQNGTAKFEEVVSRPAGHRVAIEGDVSIRGTTPLNIGELPPGTYRMTVRGRGVPRTQGRLTKNLNGSLGTRRLNGPSSLFLPPGAAHLRQEGERWRGFFMLSTGGVAITNTILKQGKVQQKEDDLRLTQLILGEAVSEEDIRQARIAVQVTAQDVEDQKEVRNLWMIASGAIWIGSGLEAWLLTPKPELRQKGNQLELITEKASPLSAVMRSALVPGGGQRYLGQYGRSNRFFLGVTIPALAAIYAHDEFLRYRRAQLNAQLQLDSATNQEEMGIWRASVLDNHDKARDAQLLRWTFVGLAGGIYLWNLLDAGTLIEESGDPTTFGFHLLPQPGGATAGFTWRIG